MIITRSPLRVTLGGGGTDLPSYYREFGGELISAGIDKYIYITLHRTFVPEFIIKYSRMERVNAISEIQHPIIREAVQLVDIPIGSLELTSMADIPAGTGLGSSGSFTTALLQALHTYKNNFVTPQSLAEEACDIEINRLGEPIGKQDQYIDSFGGLTVFKFNTDDTVTVEPLRIDRQTLYNLEDHLLMFSTGYSRSAGEILKTQDDKSKQRDQGMINNLHFVKELGIESRKALESGDLRHFAELMHIHWEHKKKRSSQMSNSSIDAWYELGMKNGALGGKLIGAGGGGFLMFYAEDMIRLRQTMLEAGLTEVRFRFEYEGTKVVINDR